MVSILQMNKETAEGVLFQVNFFQRSVSAPVIFLIKSTDMASWKHDTSANLPWLFSCLMFHSLTGFSSREQYCPEVPTNMFLHLPYMTYKFTQTSFHEEVAFHVTERLLKHHSAKKSLDCHFKHVQLSWFNQSCKWAPHSCSLIPFMVGENQKSEKTDRLRQRQFKW